MKKKTQEGEDQSQKETILTKEQTDLIVQENQAYRAILNMQNESYYRKELIDCLTVISETLKEINVALIDNNKILINLD